MSPRNELNLGMIPLWSESKPGMDKCAPNSMAEQRAKLVVRKANALYSRHEDFVYEQEEGDQLPHEVSSQSFHSPIFTSARSTKASGLSLLSRNSSSVVSSLSDGVPRLDGDERGAKASANVICQFYDSRWYGKQRTPPIDDNSAHSDVFVWT